jgi:tripartite-type tricarboxylate transporter receptor subunit TctC
VTSSKRSDDLPQVPTIAESGYKGFDAVTWFGIAGPANLPKETVTKLNAAFNKAVETPEVVQKLGAQGADVLSGSPEKFGELIRTDLARWAPLVKAAGAKVD